MVRRAAGRRLRRRPRRREAGRRAGALRLARPVATALVASALALATLSTGCGGGAADGPATTASASPSRLDAAIAALNTARGKALSAVAALDRAAAALDHVDELAAAGDPQPLAGSWTATTHAVASGAAQAKALPAAAAAYGRALAALATARRDARERDRAAIDAVVAAGRAESAAVAAVAAAGAGWPVYDALAQRARLWWDRASAGWFRTQAEAANAYAVMLAEDRPALDRTRDRLATADRARHAATSRMEAALAAARRALAG